MRYGRRKRSASGQQADAQQAALGARGPLPHRQDLAARGAAPAAGTASDQGLARPRSRADAEISRERWRLDVYGAVEHPMFWDFAQFTAQPQTQIHLRHPLRHHLVALRQSVGGARHPRPPRWPAGRATRPASSCCIPMTATPPTSRWRISPPRTPCSRIPGPARRWSRSMAARCGWWCRISISGKARNGCRASNSSSTMRRATGKSAAITTAAIRGPKQRYSGD